VGKESFVIYGCSFCPFVGMETSRGEGGEEEETFSPSLDPNIMYHHCILGHKDEHTKKETKM
jgi:hypothetical protein